MSEDKSLFFFYVLSLIVSVAFLFFHIGKKMSYQRERIVYRFIPKNHEELEKENIPSDIMTSLL